jgi:hypothetical protein
MNQPTCNNPAAPQTVTLDPVSIVFDWEPTIKHGCAHFQLRLERKANRSIGQL